MRVREEGSNETAPASRRRRRGEGPSWWERIFVTGQRIEPDLAEKLVDFVLLRQIPKKTRASIEVAPQTTLSRRSRTQKREIISR
jgi:hypothetical protein